MTKPRITVAAVNRPALIEAFNRIHKGLSGSGEPCRPGIRGHCGDPICERCRPETD